MLCVGGYMLLDQQGRVIKPIRLSNILETHETH